MDNILVFVFKNKSSIFSSVFYTTVSPSIDTHTHPHTHINFTTTQWCWHSVSSAAFVLLKQNSSFEVWSCTQGRYLSAALKTKIKPPPVNSGWMAHWLVCKNHSGQSKMEWHITDTQHTQCTQQPLQALCSRSGWRSVHVLMNCIDMFALCQNADACVFHCPQSEI